MENNQTLITLNKRNTETVEMVLKDMNKRLYDQEIALRNQNDTIQSLILKINSLEQLLTIQKVLMTGTGPTVK